MRIKSYKTRLFIQNNESNYLLMSLEQAKDGSIYGSWPDFSKTIWPYIQTNDSKVRAEVITSIDNGKLSVHGSGLTGFREHKTPKHRLAYPGSPLLKRGEQEVRGVRHLFTFFTNEPYVLPNSPYSNRESDLLFKLTAGVKPFVLILLAVPIGIATIDFRPSFRFEDYNLNDMLGSGLFSLRFHQVFWFMYKNKNHINWPKQPHCFFHDGYHIPFLIGLPEDQSSLVYLKPTYKLENKVLSISLSLPSTEFE